MTNKGLIKKDETDPLKYHYTQRRREILKFILQAGHPDLISQTELAKRYGVTQGQISHDIKAIGKEIKENLGTDAELVTEAVYQSAIKKLMKGDNKDVYNAAKLIKDWNDWLFNIGAKEKAPDKVVHGHVHLFDKFNEEYEKVIEHNEE